MVRLFLLVLIYWTNWCASVATSFSGHSIFIVLGDLPACNADEVLSACPVSEQTEGSFTHSPDIINIDNDEDTEEDKDLKLALLRSMQDENPVPASQSKSNILFILNHINRKTW